MAYRLIFRRLRNLSSNSHLVTVSKIEKRFASNQIAMDKSSVIDWKGAVDKLLVVQRGTNADGIVFTQQKYASIFCKSYRHATSNEERRNVLKYLVSQYGRSNVKNVAIAAETEEKWLSDMTRLLKDAPPPYQQLFRAIGQLGDGIKFLVDLRADVLVWIRDTQESISEKQAGESDVHLPALKLMNFMLRDLLGIWFSIGLLDVERVTWKSPCDLLQRVAEYESVHPVRSWTDLKRRVGPQRRCFVFTHPSMPGEPLVVLHVALMDKISEKIKDVISLRKGSQEAEEDLTNVNTAIFYSINSTQPGLQGIDLGHFLIKRVVQQLSAELPTINAFSSLSPIPGFRKWLTAELRKKSKGHDEQKWSLDSSEIALLADSLIGEKNDWYADENGRNRMRPILLRACAYYLLRVKHRAHAYDPVANFHLRNGAVLWRLNWEGDTTAKGLNQSCSLMVNYRYYLNRTDENSRLYLDEKQINVHEQVSEYLQNPIKRSAL